MATPINQKLYVTYVNGLPSFTVMSDISSDPNVAYLQTQYQEIKSEDQLRQAAQVAQQYYTSQAQAHLNGGWSQSQVQQSFLSNPGALYGKDIGSMNLDQLLSTLQSGGYAQGVTADQVKTGIAGTSNYVTLTPEEQKLYGFDSPYADKASFEAAKQQKLDIESGKLSPIGTAQNGQILYAPSGSAATQTQTQPRFLSNQTTAQPMQPIGGVSQQQLVQFDPNTGSALSPGQSVSYQGQTYTQGQPMPTQSTQNTVQFDPNTGSRLSAGQSVTYQGQTYTQGQPMPTNTEDITTRYGLTGEFAQLANLFQGFLAKLTANGQSVNPKVDITPERVSEFMKQAQSNIDQFIPYANKEIAPFFENQLKIAREGFLRGLGYTQQQLVDHEAELERKFTESQKGIGESAADQGFAQSGMRRFNEQQNVDETQRAIQQGRAQVGQQVTGLASQFAQSFGTDNLPGFNVGSTPTVGDTGFNRSGTSPFYQLSPETYSGLKGDQQFAQEAATRSRAAELEQAFRTDASITQQRNLTV